MSAAPARGPSDEALIGAIDTSLARRGERRRVRLLQRSPSEYATSFRLENVTAALDDGSQLALILKDLDPARLPPHAWRGKPLFLIDPRREAAVYRTLLMPRHLGAAVYGIGDAGHGEAWLLLEKVAGAELYQVGDVDAWIAAAAWLARFHDACRDAANRREAVPLIEYTPDFYRVWLERAQRFFLDAAPPSRYGRAELDWMAGRFEAIVDRLRTWPPTVIHGDCYASNVLADRSESSWQVCPIDWEMAGAGPGILDLAALTSGNWSEEARRRIAAGYLAASLRGPTLDELVEAIDVAQVYLAIQCLGWFGRRRQPADHARDWLADAVDRARRLRL